MRTTIRPSGRLMLMIWRMRSRLVPGEQQQDRRPHPRKEFLECDAHQPQTLRRLKRDERRAQADINREHAANPDDRTEYV